MSGLPGIRTRLGRFGEEVAAGFITRRGGIIVGRNLRVGHNEIDVLAEVEGERVVIEVKTAASWHGGNAGSNFDDAQAHRVRDAARSLQPPVARVDLICVTVDRSGIGIRWSPRAA
jgi:putative endonuclease